MIIDTCVSTHYLRGMKHLSLALLALALTAGCAAPFEVSSEAPVYAVQDHFTLTPTEDRMEQPMADWAARWSSATGIDIQIGEGGIPVEFAYDGMPSALGGEDTDCGQTQQTYERPEIAEHRYHSDWVKLNPAPAPNSCPGWGYVFAHELGHILGGPLAQHGESGVFQGRMGPGTQYVIDEATLTAVCSSGLCTAFQPEADR